jgi:hypothetical protein
MKSLTRIVLLIALALSGGMLVVHAGQQDKPATQNKRMGAVVAIRLINTAELSYRRAHGRYADFAALAQSGQLQETENRFFAGQVSDLGLTINVQPNAEPLAGFQFHMVLGDQGQSYSLSLRAKGDTKCLEEFFSDEGGLIYHGKPLDCPID